MWFRMEGFKIHFKKLQEFMDRIAIIKEEHLIEKSTKRKWNFSVKLRVILEMAHSILMCFIADF